VPGRVNCPGHFPGRFDDVYGFTWGLNIIGQGHAAVDASFDRCMRAIGRDQPSP
jgi:hypothetical protein